MPLGPVTNLPKARPASVSNKKTIASNAASASKKSHRRQQTSISLHLSQAVAAADVAHKPSLKTVGKSDCQVKIIKASDCLVLPEEEGAATPRRAGLSLGMQRENSLTTPLLPFGVSRRASTPLSSRPGMETHYFALSGIEGGAVEFDETEDEFAHLPANVDQIRRLTSHLWAVRKTAFANGKQDGSRLGKQIAKQRAFYQEVQEHPMSLAGVTTPAVYSIHNDEAGNKIVEMAYCPFEDTLEIIMKGDANTLDWLARTIVTIVEHNVQQADLQPFSAVLPEFTSKASSLVAACRKSPLMSKDEADEVEQILQSALRYSQKELIDVLVPVGQCHGDLTLQNMLWDSAQRQMAVFDFLDCFVESPLQDIAKLFQDVRHHWFFTQKQVDASSVARILNVFCLVESAVMAAFGSEGWWPLVPLFDLFCLVRVLPYVTEDFEKDCLLAAIRRLHDEQPQTSSASPSGLVTPIIDSSPASSAPPSPCFSHTSIGSSESQAIIVRNSSHLPPKKRSQVTMIVTALGKESAEIYPDGNPKLFTVHPSGSPMLVECIRNLDLSQVDRIYIALSHSLVTAYCVDPEVVLGWFDDLDATVSAKIALVLFDKPTHDVVETVSHVIDITNTSGAIFVKDADNTFSTSIRPANCVTYSNLVPFTGNNAFFNMDRKSYATFVYDNILANVYENSYLSSIICVGGYGFASARSFLNSSACLRHSVKQAQHAFKTKDAVRLKMTDVVFRQLLGGSVFFGLQAEEYADWGSLEAWSAYMKSYRTVVFSADKLIQKQFLAHSRGFVRSKPNQHVPDFTAFASELQRPRSTIVVATKFPANYLHMVRQYMVCDGVLAAIGAESRVQFLHSYATDSSMQMLGHQMPIVVTVS